MGVTGLWTVVQPCARPIKIETLNRKRLAVDASIWIYQFLKAVRDKEGNALRNSHVVGFFRRICKLLFFGIKPVFVFDGGAPALKRQTINNRKSRREGRREDAVRTAGKLLAVQMARRAEEEERKRKEAETYGHQADVEDEGPLPENLVYVDELHMKQQERQQSRKFKKKDAYHLPDLDVSLHEMGAPNDPRIMSLEELENYARQFDNGEDINLYDFSKIDFDGPFFQSLPDADRYNILNAARIRSRLRMGYSKEQLDTMFPDRMAFSKFQIERVRERNELTQRLMNINNPNDEFGPTGAGRVAGERNREYVLVKNDGVEGGWALGVVTSKDEGQRSKPIDVDKIKEQESDEDEDWEDEDEFEDVPIEGLNRLPKPKPATSDSADTSQSALINDMAKRRQAVYSSRRQGFGKRRGGPRRPKSNPNSLFVTEDADDDEGGSDDGLVEDDLFEEAASQSNEEEADLQKAIAMSLQQDQEEPALSADEEDDYREVFQQSRVNDAKPFSQGSGLSIARLANARSGKAAVQPAATAVSDDEDEIDLQAALLESRKSKRKQSPPARSRPKSPEPTHTKPASTTAQKASPFDGPLPFERLDLGSSLLGKKKMDTLVEESEGGFEKDSGPGAKKKKQSVPLPPWFAGKLQEDLDNQRAREVEDRRREEEDLFSRRQQAQSAPTLRKQQTLEVIDLDSQPSTNRAREIFTIESSGEEDNSVIEREEGPSQSAGIKNLKAATPPSKKDDSPASDDEPLDWEESDHEKEQDEAQRIPSKSASPEFEDVSVEALAANDAIQPASTLSTKSLSPDFEDVPMVDSTANGDIPDPGVEEPDGIGITDAPFLITDEAVPENESDDEALYSDPEDEALFQSLAAEAEEHARFASTLNNRTQAENILDYERELKQLRNQQKKDRRDADEVTQTMIQECQQLLTLFGLPYVTAPMEAEAQCAELVSLGLVDGIVTDDSDIFLFGGTRVYKNMFNQAKFVECYLAPDLVQELGLDRKKLIAIAQLLGSDYTEGLPGVGPVTALEILSEFGSLDNFKDWWASVQNGTLPPSADNAGSANASSFRRKFRKSNTTKLFLPPAFPDSRVEAAYLQPEVDSDPSAFQWGVPDLEALRSYLMATIGWSRERTDEVLVPVIKDMNRREDEGTQSNITAFFGGNVGAGGFAPRRREGGGSKRLLGALGRLKERAERGDGAAEEQQGGEDVQAEDARKRASGKGKGKRKVTTATSTADEESAVPSDEAEYEERPKKTRKRGGKR